MDDAGARTALARADILLPDPVPQHPLLDGLREIGRGEYSIVLDKGDGEQTIDHEDRISPSFMSIMA